MATPLTADRLVAALRAEGVKVVEHDGWRTHNRNQAGAWGPVAGVMIHHTVSSGTASSVELCYNGYTGLPGPLCHGVIAKDGAVHLVGSGRANHAGGGDPDVLRAVTAEDYDDRPPASNEHQGSAGAVDGNSRFYGFECINLGNGADPWPAAQLDAIERASAAICRAHGWGARSVIGHLEWSDHKSDPRGFAMPGMRDRIATRLSKPPISGPTPAPVPEEDTMDPVDVWAYKGKDVPRDAYWHLRDTNTLAKQARDETRAVAARLDALEQQPLTDEQVAQIARAVATHPGLADALADALAARLAN